MMRILVVDDHAVVREGIKQILASQDDIVVEDEAGNGTETLCKVMKNNFDMVLLDISMPGRNGLEVLEEIKERYPNATRTHSQHAPGRAICRPHVAGRRRRLPDQRQRPAGIDFRYS